MCLYIVIRLFYVKINICTYYGISKTTFTYVNSSFKHFKAWTYERDMENLKYSYLNLHAYSAQKEIQTFNKLFLIWILRNWHFQVIFYKVNKLLHSFSGKSFFKKHFRKPNWIKNCHKQNSLNFIKFKVGLFLYPHSVYFPFKALIVQANFLGISYSNLLYKFE